MFGGYAPVMWWRILLFTGAMHRPSLGFHSGALPLYSSCHYSTRAAKKRLKKINALFSFCVDHLSLLLCFLSSNNYYSTCHMHLISTAIHSAPVFTSIFTSLVVCEDGDTVNGHHGNTGENSTCRYIFERQLMGGCVGRLVFDDPVDT